MSLVKADMEIAALYSGLAPDQEWAKRIFQPSRRIRAHAQVLLEISEHAELLENEPIIQRAVHLRNPYVDPLNYIQVEMLRRLRASQPDEPEGAGTA